ncbi:hypothetical protein [Glaciimonas immobilis]|uniref:Uncharacterized protein n=1 Tax=Glaciimonas immobilis TaxID=728004 RepID=A0A840RSN8_9BURK|nr:hypothetical protein [Glaciimonas immobilis]KAF3997498.1 hypothetical protein HAV38_12520 [Glaciimonas immobilis]MBB5200825.1 hypothetical protein [Glaciimonas immobilis]
MTFDITADISRQRSGDKKIVKLFDSGLDVMYPLVAWIVGRNIPVSFTRGGQEGPCPCKDLDVHTLPEPLPLIVSYHNINLLRQSHGYESLHLAIRNSDDGTISVSAHTYDPNTGESSAKTVWRKGE